MKKLVLIITALLALSTALFAEGFTEYNLSNGIPVYVKKNTVNHIDSVCVIVKGGIHYYQSEYSGLEKALFTMMTKGSVRYSIDDLKELEYETGCSFESASDYEGSWLSLTTIDDYLTETLPVLLNGFTNPSYNSSEYNKLLTAYGESIQSMLNSPADMAEYYGRKLIFQNHEYETSPDVTPESLNNLTIAAMKNLHNQLMDSRRIYVVAVTNKAAEEYMPLLEQELGSIQTGNTELKSTMSASVTVNKRPLVLTHGAAEGTGYYYRAFTVPSVVSEEYLPYLLACKIYDQTMHNVLRVKYGMCYVAGNTDLQIIPNVGQEVIYRCSDAADIKNRLAEARSITASGKYILDVDKNDEYILADISSGFEGFRNTLINALYGNHLTTAGMANLVTQSILLYGTADDYENQLNRIKTVTKEQVLEVFNKYFVTDKDFWYACVAPELEEETEDELSR